MIQMVFVLFLHRNDFQAGLLVLKCRAFPCIGSKEEGSGPSVFQCDIRPEWPKCNLCRIRIFSSEPSGSVIIKN